MTGRTGYDLREGAQMIRDRILASTGPCVGFSRDRHVDLIAAVVLGEPAPDIEISDVLNARARRIAGQRKRDGLETKRRIAHVD